MEDARPALFPGVHPNALRCVSKNPKYVSAGRQEYRIYKEPEAPMWYIKRWPRGPLPKSLQTSFLSFNQCEEALIEYLKDKDKWGKAIYPGKLNGSR